MEVSVRFVELRLRHPWRISRGSLTAKRVAVVEARWQGLVGRGEAAPSDRFGEKVDDVPEAVARLLPLARDPFTTRALGPAWDRALPGFRGAKAALQSALLDLAGQAMGAPLYRMLGVDPATMPPTSLSIGLDTPEMVARKAREAAGFAVLKVKVGTPDDREVVAAVRSVTDQPLRVDANEGWKTREEALSRIEWLAAQGVELVEQPLPAADVEGLRWLAERSPVPIVADEAVARAEDVPRVAGACHGVNVKLMKCGGVQEALALIATARAHGLKVMLGCMIESGLGLAAAAHIAPLCDWVDLDSNLLLAEDPFPGHPVVDGRIRLREAPGLGIAA